jgi:hypothetical protein
MMTRNLKTRYDLREQDTWAMQRLSKLPRGQSETVMSLKLQRWACYTRRFSSIQAIGTFIKSFILILSKLETLGAHRRSRTGNQRYTSQGRCTALVRRVPE